MTLAWELQLPPTPKLVLLALCDWSDDSGHCFHGMATIARRTSISKRQCQRVMGELIAAKWIAVTGNQKGGTGSRRYQLNLGALRQGGIGDTGDKLTAVARMSSPGVTPASKTDDMDVIGTSYNRQFDPPLPQGPSQALDWTYLSALAAAEHVVVVNMLNGLDASQHQDVVDELAGALRAKAIKTQWPSWFRGLVQRARIGAFVSNHALAIQCDRQRVAQESADAEKRRSEAGRRTDPAARAKGFAAMAAAIADLKRFADTTDAST